MERRPRPLRPRSLYEFVNAAVFPLLFAAMIVSLPSKSRLQQSLGNTSKELSGSPAQTSQHVPTHVPGDQSPSGVTEALADALAMGGSTPALKTPAPEPALTPRGRSGDSFEASPSVRTPLPEGNNDGEKKEDEMRKYYAVWVGGIARHTREADLAAAFRPFAVHHPLLSVHIVRQPKETLGADDLGFVNFYDKVDAESAYSALVNNTIIGGKKVKLRPPRERIANVTQLNEYRQSSILRDKRPDPSIPITTKYVTNQYAPFPGNSPPSSFSTAPIPPSKSSRPYNPNRRRRGKGYYRPPQSGYYRPPQQQSDYPPPRSGRGGGYRGTGLTEHLERLHIGDRAAAPGSGSGEVLNLNRPYIGAPQDVFPYRVWDLVNPSASIERLEEARSQGGKEVMQVLQKGMTNGIPFISVAGCPEWVPLTVMPHAIDHIRSQPRPNPSEPIHMLLVVGRPKHGDLSLDKGVLASLRDLEHLFAEPATPLVPANRLERPGHRPISYLLVIKPLKQE